MSTNYNDQSVTGRQVQVWFMFDAASPGVIQIDFPFLHREKRSRMYNRGVILGQGLGTKPGERVGLPGVIRVGTSSEDSNRTVLDLHFSEPDYNLDIVLEGPRDELQKFYRQTTRLVSPEREVALARKETQKELSRWLERK